MPDGTYGFFFLNNAYWYAILAQCQRGDKPSGASPDLREYSCQCRRYCTEDNDPTDDQDWNRCVVEHVEWVQMKIDGKLFNRPLLRTGQVNV